MSRTMTDKPFPPDTIAGEYVLGLLTGNDLHDARERLASDREFASEVARWQGRFASLHAETQAVEPPLGVWHKIVHELAGQGAANDNAAMLHRRLVIWKSLAGAMTAIAASLALLLIFEPPAGPIQAVHGHTQAILPPMVAMLGSGGSMKVVASWNPAARQLVLAVPGDMATDPDHSNQLWVIPAGGKPRSLGTMPASKQMHMQLANALAVLLQQGATIAISIEPRGGSPTGSPTGPVVASGALARA